MIKDFQRNHPSSENLNCAGRIFQRATSRERRYDWQRRTRNFTPLIYGGLKTKKKFSPPSTSVSRWKELDRRRIMKLTLLIIALSLPFPASHSQTRSDEFAKQFIGKIVDNSSDLSDFV